MGFQRNLRAKRWYGLRRDSAELGPLILGRQVRYKVRETHPAMLVNEVKEGILALKNR